MGKWFGLGVPRSWDDVLIQTVKVALIAFSILVLKEWLETHEWDLKACAIDGGWIAAGVLAVNGLLHGLFPRRMA